VVAEQARLLESRQGLAIDGTVLESPAVTVPEGASVTVDGKPLPSPEPTRLFRYHKPAGILTAARDPEGRPTIYDRLPEGLPRLMPIGRLDMASEGLLLLTNDGPLTHRLLHPRYALPRLYEVEVAGRVTPADVPRWRRGVTLDDGPAVPLAVELVRGAAVSSLVRLTFTEGRKHEVKRYCDALGHRVQRLRRIAFGPLRLGALRPGACRPLTPGEVAALRAAAARPSV